MQWSTLSVLISMAATVAFAVTAVLAIRVDRDLDIFGATVLGLITAVGGGILRDVLAGRRTLLMRRELYAVPVCLGCITFVAVLRHLPDLRYPVAIVCIFATFALRAAAIHWNLSMPVLTRTGGEKH